MSAALWEADVNLAEWLFAFAIEQQEPHVAEKDVLIFFAVMSVFVFLLAVLFAGC